MRSANWQNWVREGKPSRHQKSERPTSLSQNKNSSPFNFIVFSFTYIYVARIGGGMAKARVGFSLGQDFINVF